jgi:glycosyltransferase involved in cell wall biosynthesis
MSNVLMDESIHDPHSTIHEFEHESQTASAQRRALFVSYQFPPVGGAGVQRPAKFVKYLRDFGWDASVLTAANPSVPVFDDSLCADLPDDLIIEKARTLEPGYALKRSLGQSASNGAPASGGLKRTILAPLRRAMRFAAGLALQPDPQILWLPNAYRSGLSLLRRLRHDVIFATAPAYTNLLIGVLLSRRTGLPLVVDFRDEWDLSSQYLENSQRDWFSKFIQPRMQRWVLRHASAIVATTQASTRAIALRAAQAGSRAESLCIYNGFDPCDFGQVDGGRWTVDGENELPSPSGKGLFAKGEDEPADHSPFSILHSPFPPSRFRLVYTGTLWNLTSIAPVVEAIERLNTEAPEIAEQLELVCVGRKTPQQQTVLDRIDRTRCRLENVSYCEHKTALRVMNQSDALLLLLSDVAGAERVAPAKLFEYLAIGRPMLTVTPDGETAGISRRFFPDGHCVPGDVAGIAAWIKTHVTEWQRSGRSSPEGHAAESIAPFTRRHQAGQLAELLNRVTVEQR